MLRFTFCLVIVLACQRTHASHEVVGEAPSFNSRQNDIVVFESNEDGSNADLMLSCNVSGVPTPSVTWFREGTEVDSQFVLIDGSLFVANITEGDYASIEGVVYYCTATNYIGESNYTATIRSREITVHYAFFNGFKNTEETTVIVPASVSADVSLECDVLGANPPPEIEWFRSDVLETPILEEIGGNEVRFQENSRYLYIRPAELNFANTYYCAVTNALLHQRNVSGTRYSLNQTGLAALPMHVYKPIGNVTAFVGDTDFEFSYVAAAGLFPQSCDFFVNGVEVNDLGAFGTIETVRLTDSGPLECRLSGQVITSGSLIVNDRVAFTGSPMSDRDVVVGSGEISYTCPHTGTPAPSLAWYHNGEVISAPNGVNIVGNVLTIASPQESNSGVYQCFIENSVSNTMTSWVVEVREPEPPQALAFNLTEIGAVDDRRLGALIVRDAGAMVTVSAYIAADPCPELRWFFEGNSISNGEDYVINNPCIDDDASSPFQFTLTVNNLTNQLSGAYSANFTNLAGSDELPELYITIPANTSLTGLTLNVLQDDIANCLLNTSNVTITCNSEGFPRPSVVFRNGPATIVPGTGSFSRYTQPFSDQLLITDVKKVDEGAYTCAEVDDSMVDISVSQSTTFDFCTKPVILDSETSQNTFVGEELFAECQFAGTPEPDFQWRKGDDPLMDTMDGSLRIIIRGDNQDISRVEVNSAQLSNAGTYTCVGTNDAGSAMMTFQLEVNDSLIGGLSLGAIIGIAAGGAGAILLVVLIILLLVCVYMCARSSKKGGVNLQPYNVSGGKMYTDYSADGRGNVDKDSDEEEAGQPEAFNPEYESLPALRPAQPPMYKPTPSYPHGGPLTGDDMEMVKVPPPDTDSFVGVPPYRKDNGMPDYRPSPDDFLSEDAQFV